VSLLTLIQGAALKIGVDKPNSVVGSSNVEVQELLELANEEGMELVRRGDWQVLRRGLTFTTISGETQTGMVPNDYDHMISGTIWNSTKHRKIDGVVTPQIWQQIKSSNVGTIYDTLYMRGGDFLLSPTPAGGDVITGEYVTKNFCQSSGGAEQAEWLADTDTGILPEQLMKLGLVVRYKLQKGLDATADLAHYETQVVLALGMDKPARKVNFADGDAVGFGLIVPETGYGS